MASAQDIPPSEQWNKTFGGKNDGIGFAVRQTPDGGYILGCNKWTRAHNWDFWLIKVDANGIEQWNKTYGGELADSARSILQTSDGGYLLAGYTKSYVKPYDIGYSDGWLVKTDANGTEQWNKTFGGTVNDGFNSILQTSNGGYMLAGYTRSYGAGSSDAWLVKTDTNGIEQWNRTFGETYRDGLNSILETKDGGYMFVGVTRSTESGSADAWLVKIDANGTEQWNKTFGETYSDRLNSILETKDGGYILVGVTSSIGGGGLWLIKTNGDGIEQWNKTLRGGGASSILQTSDGGYILAGTRGVGQEGLSDAWLVKIDANGTEQWNKTYGGAYADGFNSILPTSDGGYILLGYTRSYGGEPGYARVYNVWLIKLGFPPNSMVPATTITPRISSTETPTQTPTPAPTTTSTPETSTLTPTPTSMSTPTPKPTIGPAEISTTPTKPAPGFDLITAAIGLTIVIYLETEILKL